MLPQPFTGADEDADYRWQLSVKQAESSTTMALDRPLAGRSFLRAGDPRQPGHGPPGQGEHRLRPDHPPALQVPAPGTFRTQVIMNDTCPYLYQF
jgi:hypothetical protein